MATATKGKTWADNENVTYTDLNSNFDTIYNEFNGSISNANIDASANIAASKISGTAVTLSGTQTLTGDKTHQGKNTFLQTVQTIDTATDGSTVTFDLSAGNIHTVTLGGNRTLALSNVSSGQAFTIILKQDATGSRTVTWWSDIKWVAATEPTLTTTASRYDIFSFLYDGTNYYGSIVGLNFG